MPWPGLGVGGVAVHVFLEKGGKGDLFGKKGSERRSFLAEKEKILAWSIDTRRTLAGESGKPPPSRGGKGRPPWGKGVQSILGKKSPHIPSRGERER